MAVNFKALGELATKSVGTDLVIGKAVANHYGVFIPNGVISLVDPMEWEENIERSLIEIAQELAFQNETASTIYCAGVALSNPTQILDMLNTMACNLCGTMAQILNNVMYAVQMQIDIAIGNVIGSIGNFLSSIIELANSILRLTEALLNLPQELKNLAREQNQRRLTADDCMDRVADILSCLLNKYLGQPLMDFQDKIIGKVNEFGYTVNQAIVDEFADLDVVSNYIQRESFMLNQASMLTQGLYADFGTVKSAADEEAERRAKEDAAKLKVDENGKASAPGTNVSSKPLTNTPAVQSSKENKSEATKKVEKAKETVSPTSSNKVLP